MIPSEVEQYLRDLHTSIQRGLAALDPSRPFTVDPWSRGESNGVTAIIEDGDVLERAGIGFSLVRGDKMPEAASVRHPEIVGKPFIACGVSLVVHPKNPYVPTTHMNVRGFFSEHAWWFGGGYDLTPYYPFEADVRAWHRTAKEACDPTGPGVYAAQKAACDDYFYLPHRKEPRGVGGIFFDDFSGDFARCFAHLRRVGDSFLAAYRPIVLRRKDTPYGARERAFQLYRRGRYVEFNLVFDRGTKFGLQYGGRIESILLSMPPLATWRYDWHPEDEARLLEVLRPRDWIGDSAA
jgi:coproporphyrinogen III oxidase